ncbi:MAG: hypothetical protein HPY69_07100 [Armatimonadetes bacterium]|nr:hypothetical protein [Armatimonadota bacterium]
MGEHHDHDIEKLREVLDIVGDRVPALINQLKSTLFSAEAGQELGRAVGAFYRELVDSGIPAEEALEMAKSYVGTLQGVLKNVNIKHGE